MMNLARIHTVLPIIAALLGGAAISPQALALGQPAAATGDKADGKKDLESLAGTWNVDRQGWGDTSLLKELLKGYQFVFAGGKLTWDAAIGMMSKGGKISAIEGAYTCDFKIDPSQKPKHIEITVHLKQGDRTLLGIYEIKGDTLKVSITAAAQANVRANSPARGIAVSAASH